MTSKQSAGPPRTVDGADPSYSLRQLETFGATDVGRVRAANQDNLGKFGSWDRGLIMLCVADGMGGHRAGEVASEMAIDAVKEVFEAGAELPPDLLMSALRTANHKIFSAASRDANLSGMGTTAVAMLLDGSSQSWIAHVGDSRAYRLRAGRLEQLTGDHSVVGELVRRGQLTSEEARVHPHSNEILRALGTQPEVDIELTPINVQPGDRFLLCSDGLSGMLPDPEIEDVLGREAPRQAAEQLIQFANEAGGTDNITVQIARVPEGDDPQTTAALQAESIETTVGVDAMENADPSTEGGDMQSDADESENSGSMPWTRWAIAAAILIALFLLYYFGSDANG